MGGVGRPEVSIAASLRFQPAFHGSLLLILWGLLLVGIVMVGFSMNRTNHSAGMTPATESYPSSILVSASHNLRLPLDYTFPTGSESPGPVTFCHKSHIDKEKPDCVSCHAKLFQITVPGKPVRAELTSQQMHGAELCGACHNGKDAFSIEDDCGNCHRE
jgi:c(7)-type cytochrome triheme protein